MAKAKHLTFYGTNCGIGNRVEELISIQEYCINNDATCKYIWLNNPGISNRSYRCRMTFDRITICEETTHTSRTGNRNIFMRTPGFIPRYKFTFDVDIPEPYDTIIHIRGGDRLSDLPMDVKYDYSSKNELNDFIEKTISYVNNNADIKNYTVVSDEPALLKYTVNKINKHYCKLSYEYKIGKPWLDYYYLTKASHRVVMCSKLSSYALTAAMLSDLTVDVFFISHMLDRFKAKVHIIDTDKQLR